jgi:hypothetical protein
MIDKDTYLGNALIKRDGVTHEWTQYEVDEYIKCMQSPAYFARNYIKVINLDRGLVDFELYPYQEKMFEHFTDNRFNIVLAARQSGKSIASVVWLLHYSIFNPETNIAILANKGATAREMLSRITLALENLPFFLQPGCKTLNKGSIHFSNNSKIFAASTSSSSVRGFSVNVVYLDEFAFVNRADEFYTSTYPVITSGENTKVIITSTANGVGNLYHRLWQGAVQGTNQYKPFRVDWWDVPGRDERWKEETISNTSEMQFRQEMSNEFLGMGDTLISPEFLLKLKSEYPIFEQDNVRLYEQPIQEHEYMMFVDVAKGRGQDYSTFNIIDITARPFKQIGIFRDNLISPLLFPDIIYKYAKMYNDAWVIVESNDAGQVVCNGLYYELEYENVFVESAIKANSIGVNMNRKVKRIGCSTIKDLIERDKLHIVDDNTIIEISTFVAHGSSYEASDGNHDDLMMTLVMFGWFTTTTFFNNMTDVNIRQMLYDERIKQIEDDLPPFGLVDDGINEMEEVITDKYGDRWFTAESF